MPFKITSGIYLHSHGRAHCIRSCTHVQKSHTHTRRTEEMLFACKLTNKHEGNTHFIPSKFLFTLYGTKRAAAILQLFPSQPFTCKLGQRINTSAGWSSGCCCCPTQAKSLSEDCRFDGVNFCGSVLLSQLPYEREVKVKGGLGGRGVVVQSN